MTKVYYFSPECNEELFATAPLFTEEECEKEYIENKDFEVYKYSEIKDFEEAFNNGFISDLGFVRFF